MDGAAWRRTGRKRRCRRTTSSLPRSGQAIRFPDVLGDYPAKPCWTWSEQNAASSSGTGCRRPRCTAATRGAVACRADAADGGGCHRARQPSLPAVTPACAPHSESRHRRAARRHDCPTLGLRWSALWRRRASDLLLVLWSGGAPKPSKLPATWTTITAALAAIDFDCAVVMRTIRSCWRARRRGIDRRGSSAETRRSRSRRPRAAEAAAAGLAERASGRATSCSSSDTLPGSGLHLAGLARLSGDAAVNPPARWTG